MKDNPGHLEGRNPEIIRPGDWVPHTKPLAHDLWSSVIGNLDKPYRQCRSRRAHGQAAYQRLYDNTFDIVLIESGWDSKFNERLSGQMKATKARLSVLGSILEVRLLYRLIGLESLKIWPHLIVSHLIWPLTWVSPRIKHIWFLHSQKYLHVYCWGKYHLISYYLHPIMSTSDIEFLVWYNRDKMVSKNS